MVPVVEPPKFGDRPVWLPLITFLRAAAVGKEKQAVEKNDEF